MGEYSLARYSRRQLAKLAAAATSFLALSKRSGFAGGVGTQTNTETKLSFLAVGDWGQRGSKPQKEVAAAMTQIANQRAPKFIISLGDNFYPDGVVSAADEHWQQSFESVYSAASLQVPWYPVLGNHDRKGVAMAQVAYSQLSSRWRMPSAYYWRNESLPDGTGIDFFFLDTNLIIADHAGIHAIFAGDKANDQITWVDQALAASKAHWKIVIGHHPVYSGGPYGSTPELLAVLKPILDRHHVHAYLAGHEHNMQHLVVDGIHYLTCGAGATLRPSGHTNYTVFSKECLGFLEASVTAHSLDISFRDSAGTVLHTASLSRPA